MPSQPAQSCAKPGDLWSAIAELSSEQLHTIIDIALASPKAPADLASFRHCILHVFRNVAGFESTPPSDSILLKLWDKYSAPRASRTPVRSSLLVKR